MRSSGSAATAGAWGAAAGVARGSIAQSGGGEGGKLFGQLSGLAPRTWGALPITGTNEHFAVVSALLTMKFVNRHAAEYSLPDFTEKRGSWDF